MNKKTELDSSRQICLNLFITENAMILQISNL